jgi:hypothetical protein
VTYLVLVEPADEHRQAFARWCLAQDPPIMTASSTGSQVPADLFTTVPDELLDGAYIDGHVFRPVLTGKVPEGDGHRDEQSEQDPPKPRGRRTTRKGHTP